MNIFEPTTLTGKNDSRLVYKGKCTRCGIVHGVPIGHAKDQAVALLKRLDAAKRIDFDVPESEADPRFSTDYLFGDALGQMFGVLVCRDRQGQTGVLKAFSGQYNGEWLVDGWVPPLVDVDLLHDISFGAERLIKHLGSQIDELPETSIKRQRLVEKRKAISKALMKDIHGLYRIPNFRGEVKPLPDAVHGDGGIPTGTGDCCAPKLLGYAATHGLTPLGLAEFYFGADNKSGTKRHGAMYTSCKVKCDRILGYMLCGQGKTCPISKTD